MDRLNSRFAYPSIVPMARQPAPLQIAKPIFAILVCALLLLAPPRAEALPVAWLRNVKPVVQVSESGNSWQSGRERTRLTYGNYIRAGAGGKTDVLFANGTELALNSGTQIQIVAPPSEDKPLVVRVFGALSELFVRAKGNTEIRSAAGTAAVRGTQYLVRLPTADSMEVTVLEGTVAVSNPQGSVLVNANQRSTASVGQPPTPPVAVDTSGLNAWSADITGLPVEFEMPFHPADAATLQRRRAECEAAVQTKPHDAAAHRALGEVLYDQGQYSGAVAEFQFAAQPASGDAVLQTDLARAQLGQGDAPAAIATCRQVIAADSNNTQARVVLALAYLSQQHENDARASLEPVRDRALPRVVLCLIELRHGHYKEAMEHFGDAVAMSPEEQGNGGAVVSLAALAFLARGQIDEAIHWAREGASSAPYSAQAQGTLAMVLFFAGQNGEAMGHAKKAVELNPLSPFAQLTLGSSELAQGNLDAARQAYQAAVALAPDLPLAQTELGACYLRLDIPKKAEVSYRRALEFDPNSSDAHAGLGLALQAQGQSKEALAELHTAVALRPNSATAHGDLATYYIEMGQFDQAQTELEQGVKSSPQRGILYVRFSEIALYRQDLAAAQNYARRAVELLPNSAPAHYQLGRVYLEQERNLQAEEEFRQAVTLDPRMATAQYALGYIQEKTEQNPLLAAGTILGPDAIGSPGSTLTLQNLQTPGANLRIQAALADPTVVRTATRSYGDTELDGLLGQDRTQDFSASHLQAAADQRGEWGISGERQSNLGQRDNSDFTYENASAFYGQKNKSNPSGFFISGEYEEQSQGLNNDVPANAGTAMERLHDHIPRLLAGYNFQTDQRSSTRVLFQASQTYEEDPFLNSIADSAIRFHSVDGEIRHDVALGDRQLVSVGFSTGERIRDASSVAPFLPLLPILIDFHNRLAASQEYVRDEFQLNKKWKLIGQFSLEHQKLQSQSNFISPFPGTLSDNTHGTQGVPYLVAEYQANARSSLRFRARHLYANIQDFELLTPVDVFLFSYADLPQAVDPASTFAHGTSYEFEHDYTFKNASFLRYGIFQQDLDQADVDGAQFGAIPEVRLRGIRADYEGLLSHSVSYFLGTEFTSARDVQLLQYVPQVPKVLADASVQYLDRQGYFFQPLFIYESSRIVSTTDTSSLGGFSIVNLRFGKRQGLRSEVFLELNDAFNKQYDVLGVLQPGRQLRAGTTYRF